MAEKRRSPAYEKERKSRRLTDGSSDGAISADSCYHGWSLFGERRQNNLCTLAGSDAPESVSGWAMPPAGISVVLLSELLCCFPHAASVRNARVAQERSRLLDTMLSRGNFSSAPAYSALMVRLRSELAQAQR